jgi:hypothetical protein
MTLFPWCMMWIVAHRIPEQNIQAQQSSPSLTIEQTPVSNTEL